MPSNVPPISTAGRRAGPRTQVRRSGVHGRGVFALQDIAEGEIIVEYAGKRISYEESQDRHPHDPANPNHTFFFQLDGERCAFLACGTDQAPQGSPVTGCPVCVKPRHFRQKARAISDCRPCIYPL